MMTTTASYILIAIAALTVIALIELLINPAKKSVRLSPLTAISFAFVMAGTFFAERTWFGYALMGTGILLTIVDMIRKFRRSKQFDQ
jgi:hypothetical protein